MKILALSVSVLGIAVLALIIMNIRLNMRISRLIKKYDRFMQGKDGRSLDETIAASIEKVEELTMLHNKTQLEFYSATNELKSTFSKMGIVKYNAFKEMGGNLSFALALLNNKNSGFIINSMHGRESCYTYIKEIVNGESYAALGEEEKEALEKAMNDQ
ncbi:MAG: DUF4446 family protein [Eubacterium sp.]